MDDLGWLGKKAWHLGACRLEVAGTDVGSRDRRAEPAVIGGQGDSGLSYAR